MRSSAVPTLTDQQPQLPSTDQSTKNVDSNVDDDEEYEEIEEEVEVEEEVEEEIEEEVEVEVEEEVEEEEEKEIGDELLPTHDEDCQNDVSQVVESEGHGKHLSWGPASPKKSVASLPQTIPNIEDISAALKIPSPSETTQKEESQINGKGIPKNHNGGECESKASPRGSRIINAKAKFDSVSVEEVTAPRISGDDSGDKNSGALYLKEETKQTATQSLEDINQMAPRSHLSGIRSRSVSPGADVNGGNKRLALVCDFFAKGWCIKGKSCRFLHVKDHLHASDNKKGVTATSDAKSELSAYEGLRDSSERSGFLSLPEVASASYAKVPPQEDGQSARWSESAECPAYINSSRSLSSFNDVGRGSSVKTWYEDEHGKYPFMNDNSPIYRNTLFHGTLSSSFDTLSDTSQSSRHLLGLEGVASQGGKVVADGLLTAGMFPSTSTLSRSPLSLNPLCKNADPLGSQMWIDSEQRCHAFKSASLQESSYFGCESSLSQSNISGDTLRFSGFKTKIISDDWEPSVPFRPSVFITRSLSSPRSQYDPFRDSIEHPNIGQDKHSVTTHTNFNDSILAENSFKKKLSPLTERATAIVTEWRDKVTLSEENKSFVSAQGKDVSKDDKVGVNCDSEFQIERLRNKAEFSRVRESSEVDVDFGTDGGVHKASKILKHFRAALVDFVKELVKPTWRDGHLSKDAHKVIVKKTVDKVLGTLQAHQIPSTIELIKQYLSSSQPKIAKLVEAYIDKYSKC